MPALAATADTSHRILDVAERLVQTRGFNAFSYADIAVALRVTKATLHYHFPTKAKLGERLIERYETAFLGALDTLDATCHDAGAKLTAYVAIYADVLDNNRMCLCGMLAADHATLPKTMKDAVRHFFDANDAWLTGVLAGGRDDGELAFTGPPIEAARFLVSVLEGAMLIARSHGDAARFRSAADRLLADFGVTAPASASAPRKRSAGSR
jgi:TetR/AcrR family transcriptional repressor of nem operon